MRRLRSVLATIAQAAAIIAAAAMGALVVARIVVAHVDHQQEELMTQVDDLRAAIADVSGATDGLASQIDSVATRVLAKLAELGDPDPDLSADIAALQAEAGRINAQTTELEGIVPDVVAEPEPTPEPPVEEPAPEQPAEPPAETGPIGVP